MALWSVKEEEGYSVKYLLDWTNKRVKIKSYFATDYDALTKYLDVLAVENNLTKTILTAGEQDWQEFFVRGYWLEALHPTFFRGKAGFHVSKFYSRERRTPADWEKEEELLGAAKNSSREMSALNKDYKIRVALQSDVAGLAKLYSSVFVTYPTDVNDEGYLKEAMRKGAVFMVVTHKGQIISAASLDVDSETLSTELTDCATSPEYRGQGLMAHLLYYLEKQAKEMGLITIYTIARAGSAGINTVFAKHGYNYYGRFINNCDICGNFEDMNLWSKTIN